jgi:hypothetical protein
MPTVIETAPLRKVVKRMALRWRIDGDELICGHVVELSRDKAYHAEKRRCVRCLDDMNAELRKTGK